jgi:uncharacterized protein DUF6894
MKRYYFDIREGDHLATDEEGLMMRDIDAVQKRRNRWPTWRKTPCPGGCFIAWQSRSGTRRAWCLRSAISGKYADVGLELLLRTFPSSSLPVLVRRAS